MLTEFPDNNLAVTTRQVWDITEPEPIPRGVTVSVEDHDTCADLFVVEYEDRIYLASPDELRPHRPRPPRKAKARRSG